jgi:hypothetical protein
MIRYLAAGNENQGPQQNAVASGKQKKKKKPSSIILRMAGVIGIIAGIILVFGGYTSHPIILTILSYTNEHFSSSLSSTELYMLQLAITVFNLLVGLGGIVVIVGGTVLLMRHRTVGRILLWLGGGMGIFGLLFTMGEAYYYSHFSLVVFHAEYWIGLVLATAASLIAKRG